MLRIFRGSATKITFTELPATSHNCDTYETPKNTTNETTKTMFRDSSSALRFSVFLTKGSHRSIPRYLFASWPPLPPSLLRLFFSIGTVYFQARAILNMTNRTRVDYVVVPRSACEHPTTTIRSRVGNQSTNGDCEAHEAM